MNKFIKKSTNQLIKTFQKSNNKQTLKSIQLILLKRLLKIKGDK